MRDNKRIVVIDGKRYAIERTFDCSPAIYVNDGDTPYKNHIDEKRPAPETRVLIYAYYIGDVER